MIVAGLVLFATGAVDLLRQFAPRRVRWVAAAVAALALFVLAAGADAAVAALVAIAVAAAWVASSPLDGSGRGGLWPSALLAAVTAGAVALLPPRAQTGPLGALWPTASPLGAVSLDVTVLAVGALVFLLESANVIVRTALRVRPAAPDRATETTETTQATEATEATAVAAGELVPPLRGGRLIGPLERLLIFALALANAFILIAAVIAAKGIVRFPEISQDGGHGGRAEYFLVGSLVSWVTAFAAALLVWWAAR